MLLSYDLDAIESLFESSRLIFAVGACIGACNDGDVVIGKADEMVGMLRSGITGVFVTDGTALGTFDTCSDGVSESISDGMLEGEMVGA